VEDEARRIGDVCNLRMMGDSDSSSSTSPIPLPSTHLPTLVPGDLKRLFSIQQKALGAVSYDHQVTYCKSWLSLLSSLGIELLRKPNPLILSDLTKLEASTLAYQLIDQKKKEKMEFGNTALANSLNGLSSSGNLRTLLFYYYFFILDVVGVKRGANKRAKNGIIGGSNLLVSPGIALKFTPVADVVDIATMRNQATDILAAINEAVAAQRKFIVLIIAPVTSREPSGPNKRCSNCNEWSGADLYKCWRCAVAF
jgi:hypothetical protein